MAKKKSVIFENSLEALLYNYDEYEECWDVKFIGRHAPLNSLFEEVYYIEEEDTIFGTVKCLGEPLFNEDGKQYFQLGNTRLVVALVQMEGKSPVIHFWIYNSDCDYSLHAVSGEGLLVFKEPMNDWLNQA